MSCLSGFRIVPILAFTVLQLFADTMRAAEHQPKLEIVPQTPNSWVLSVAFSPDSARVLSGGGNTLNLWDIATGQLIRTFEAGSVNSVAFSPDGARGLSGGGATLKLWDIATGQLIRTFEGHLDVVTSVAFSPDGTRVVSGGGAAVKLWDAGTGRLLHTYESDWLTRTFGGGLKAVTSVAFSSDGTRVLSGSREGTLTLWNATTGQLMLTIKGHTGDVRSVAFSTDGVRVLSGGDDRTLKLWDSATGRLLRTFEGDSGTVYSVAFSPDGARALSGNGSTLKLWDIATGQLIRRIPGDDLSWLAVAFSFDGTRVLAGGTTLKLWDAATGQFIRTFEGHATIVNSVVFSPDGGRALSGSDDKSLKLWDAATGRLIRTFAGHSKKVSSVAFSPDGTRVLSGSGDVLSVHDNTDVAYLPREDVTLRLWDATTGQLISTVAENTRAITSGAFSPDGARVLSGGVQNFNSLVTRRTLKLWDIATGQLIRAFEAHLDVNSVAFSPNGARVISGGENISRATRKNVEALKLWDAATGQLVRSFAEYSTQVYSVAFSPDGSRVLSGGGDGTLKLWDAATGELIRTIKAHTGSVTSVAFSRDGDRVLSGGGQSIKLWDVATSQLIRIFEGHLDAVSSVAFSPDGSRVLSGSRDATVRVWNLETGQLLATLLGARDGEWLTMTPPGFFAGSAKGTEMLALVRGLELTSISQIHQSLFSPDLVREALAGDPVGELQAAATVMNLEKVLDSGPAPVVAIMSPPIGSQSLADLINVEAQIADKGNGIGRIEWRVNGITTGVTNVASGGGPNHEVKQAVALDPGENAIEVVAYNARNLLASLPAQTTITYNTPADAVKPKLYVLAIGVNTYHDEGWTPPGAAKRESFPPLKLAVDDARSIGEAFKSAGEGLYEQVIVRTAFDEEATAASLERIVRDISAQINPRDTFVLFAAAHGYSNNGRFYLLPQDYQGGTDPTALTSRAITQERLQDWVARIKARRGVILLDTCESGALTNGYAHSRTDAPASEAAVGRLHEATGRPVLTAAAAGKPAFEGYRGHGVFTWALIDALSHGDTNGDGLIELSELASHVQNTVPKISAEMNGAGNAEVLTQLFSGNRQTAHFGSTGGDFPVVKRLQ
jgi:WD40 repeat protein